MHDMIYRQVGRDEHYKIWHKPENNIFLFIHSGNGSVVTKTESYPMSKGTLCFIGKEKYHYTFPDDTNCYVRSKLFISSDQLSYLSKALDRASQLLQRFDEGQIHISALDEKEAQRVEQLFDRLNRISPLSECFQLEICSALLQLIVLLSENRQPITQDASSSIQTAVEYINDHITEDITIDRICAPVYMSKYHFCRLFKERIGTTVMDYVLKTRIMMAKELLSSGNLSVTEISEACGFSSISYFSRAFKNEVGVSPLQYKRSKLKERDKT